jgi:hypothetical protein
VTATVNGQTNTTQGNFRVVSDDAIIEEFGDSEALAFVQVFAECQQRMAIQVENLDAAVAAHLFRTPRDEAPPEAA